MLIVMPPAMDNDLPSSRRKVVDEKLTSVFLSIFAVLLIISFVTMGCESLSDPRLYIQDLYVPSLDTVLNKTTTFNTSVFIDLKFKRALASTCPDYGEFQMNLFHGKNLGLLIGNSVVEGFSMGGRKEFYMKVAVEAPKLPWEEVSHAVSTGSKVVLMVELVANRKHDSCRTLLWMDDLGPSWCRAHVAVDASGHKVSKNPIELRCFV